MKTTRLQKQFMIALLVLMPFVGAGAGYLAAVYQMSEIRTEGPNQKVEKNDSNTTDTSHTEDGSAGSNLLAVLPEEDLPKEDFLSNDLTYALGLSFVPVKDQEQRDFSTTMLNDLGIKNIRFAQNWKYIEPVQGTYDWSNLDERIAWVKENNLSLMLTIQSDGPQWVCGESNSQSCEYTNMTAFKAFIETLLQRYPNQIAKLQFGNEWHSDHWYIGTTASFIQAHNILATAVATYSPQTQVVLGGFSIGALRSLALCSDAIQTLPYSDAVVTEVVCSSSEYREGFSRIEAVLADAQYDIVDIHLYDDPENWSAYTQTMRTMTDKPIIVSEFGGPHPTEEPADDAYQASRLPVYIETLNSLGITHAYYFTVVDAPEGSRVHARSGLYGLPNLQKKAAYDVFRSYSAVP